MPYTPYYPGGWQNSPSTSTPVIAAALQNMENGITYASDWYNVLAYGADPTGGTDFTTAGNDALTASSGQTVYLPAGTYLMNGSTALAMATAGVTLRGDGPGATIIKIGSSFSAAEVFDVTAGYCEIRDLSIVGASSTTTSNPACDAILLQGGRYCRIDNVFFQYINGWPIESIATSSNAGYATMLTRLSGLNCAGGVHVKSNTNVSWGAQHFLSDLNFQSTGVGSGANANLDVFRFEDCYDISGVNFNTSVSDASTGSSINIVGNCAGIYLTNMDLGTFPNTSSETNAVITIQAGSNGSPEEVHFVQGIAQQGKNALNISGAVKYTSFESFRFFNNYGHGVINASTGFDISFLNCYFNSNGQGATGTNYDISWTGAATGQLLSCVFSSPIVSVSSAGVQNCGNFTGGNVSVKDCTADGTSVTGSNMFSNAPKYVFRCIPWNPHGAVSISVPSSGSAAAGRSFDMYFYITAGASTVSCVVTASVASQTIVIPSGGFGVVFVPAGQTLTPTYSSAPTWVVYGN